ncbi:MAG: hypothetical protein HQ521_00755 [Bacteroidetes bacterium]|nr:hypothetical protein [Bacteroidota bacterium]
MNLHYNEHFIFLRQSYEDVGNKTWLNDDFKQNDLDISRDLFTDKSLALRKPVPKKLEVFALLSGLPFTEEFCINLVAIQDKISDILNNILQYWVLPSNFGVEYCVFKWPNEKWIDSRMRIIEKELSTLNYPPFRFSIKGIQINPDGCIIAKGYDKGRVIFNIRERLKANLTILPKRQSGWAHIPIGRILEPIGSKKFGDLRRLVKKLSNDLIASEEINTVKFVHETRWYMEEKSILSEFQLN